MCDDNKVNCGWNTRARSCLRLRRWWGWVVVYIMFMQIALALGSAYNYSILFLSLLKDFKRSAALTGLVGSIANALLLSGSPVSVPLIRRFGPRFTNLLGSCLYCGGFILTAFMPGLEYILLTYGILGGFGYNFVLQSDCFVVLEWFPDKNCSRATGLAIIGSSVGMLVFAPLMNELIATHDWRNTLIIIGVGNLAISLTHGAFITLPRRTKVPTGEGKGVKKSRENRGEYPEEIDREEEADPAPTLELAEYRQEEVPTIEGRTEGHLWELLGEEAAPDPCPKVVEAKTEDRQAEAPAVEGRTEGHLWELLGEEAAPDPCPKVIKAEGNDRRRRIPKLPGLTILLRVDAWMWLLCLTLANLGWSFIIVSYASFMEQDLLLSRRQISLAIVLFSIGEIVGKIGLSLVGDHLPFLKLYVVVAGSVLGGVASALMALLSASLSMFAISFFLGLFRSGSYALPLSAAKEIFGKYSSDVVTSMALMPFGLGVFIGAPLSGGLYDVTGDYTLSLLTIAGIFLGSAIAGLVIPLKKRLSMPREG